MKITIAKLRKTYPNLEFTKFQDKFQVVGNSRNWNLVTSDRTMEVLLNVFPTEEKIKEAMQAAESNIAKKDLAKAIYTDPTINSQFESFFGKKLISFVSPMLGFNIIAFDSQFCDNSKETSLKDQILEKHGKIAVELIEKLIDTGAPY